MEVPITRQSLQAFDNDKEENELKAKEFQKKFAQLLENICTEFKKNMPSNSKKKKFVWYLQGLRQLHVPRITNFGSYNGNSSIINSGTIITENFNEHIPMLIEKLKQLFIGCDIIIDPLKTYLVIDWS
jgi:hypothetical protein